MAKRERVVFYCEGDEVVGTIFVPENLSEGDRRAAVVIVPGYVQQKEMSYGMAEDLTLLGYVALGFDYRGGQGESKYRGTLSPKGLDRIFPEAAVWDIRSAITYLTTRKEVDPERIGLLGAAVGASLVVAAAAAEQRVKCVVSEGGFGDGYRWARSSRRSWEFRVYVRKIMEDRVKRVLTGKSESIPNPEYMIINPEEEVSWANIPKYFPKMAQLELRTPLEVCERWLEFKPELVVDKISPRPILVIAEETSDIVPTEESISLYEHAKEPKKLVLVPSSIVPTRYMKRMWDKEARYIPWIWNHIVEWFGTHLPPSQR